MNKATALAVVAGVWMVAGAGVADATVNCAQVNRYLATGRSAEDLSETMVVPLEEVLKCQQESQATAGTASDEAGQAAEQPGEE